MNEPAEPDFTLPTDSISTNTGELPQEQPVFPVPPAPEPNVSLSGGTRLQVWLICAGSFLAFGVACIVMLVIGGEFQTFALAGLQTCPFAVLAVMAYASNPKGTGGRVVTVIYWTILMALTGIMAFALTVVVALQLPITGNFRTPLPQPTFDQIVRIAGTAVGLLAAAAVGLLCFWGAVRKKAAAWFATDPDSFVHSTALATTITMTLMCTIPLLAVGEPPLLWFLKQGDASKLMDPQDNLRTTFYSLVWAVPASFIAVGFPLRRTLREAQRRLALEWPTRRQIVFAVVVALVLAGLAAGPVEFLINWVWKTFGFRSTDTKAVEALFQFAMQPLVAAIVGISAGFGEELVFRGVLQPRLGIVLPALMFTAVHAFQYNFDGLVWVLTLGLIMGVIRKKTNTTTSAIVHATYDFVLLVLAYLTGS